MTLLEKLFEVTELVLETWPGTPEELGEAIYDATKLVDAPSYDQKSRAEWTKQRHIKSMARARIAAIKGGSLLLRLEDKLKNRTRYS